MSTLNPVQIISAIYGPEPMREGEYPSAYSVGHKTAQDGAEVTSIVARLQDLGDRGIQWFDVWCGDVRLASLNATSVAEIRYAATVE